MVGFNKGYHYYKWQIDYTDDRDRLEYISDYLQTTLYENAVEVCNDKELTSWIFENVGRSYAYYIDFITVENDDIGVIQIYYIDEDGSLKCDDSIDNTNLTVEVNRIDYDFLESHGFDFDRSINLYLHSMAQEMRQSIEENMKRG